MPTRLPGKWVTRGTYWRAQALPIAETDWSSVESMTTVLCISTARHTTVMVRKIWFTNQIQRRPAMLIVFGARDMKRSIPHEAIMAVNTSLGGPSADRTFVRSALGLAVPRLDIAEGMAGRA